MAKFEGYERREAKILAALKEYGISSRSRLFEVNEAVRKINQKRKAANRNRAFTGSSCDKQELAQHPDYELAFHTAVPRMALYMEYSTRIYGIYLKYIAPEDIHVYSIDEVFIDVTSYLKTYQMDAHELAILMIRDVLRNTGITATAGIGTNMYLAKVAMDIVAKHIAADSNGVRIAKLDERRIQFRSRMTKRGKQLIPKVCASELRSCHTACTYDNAVRFQGSVGCCHKKAALTAV